jgi:hypothetical protein
MPHRNLKELAHRRQNGLEVTLLWDAGSNSVSVEVVDEREDSGFVVPVRPTAALDAFYHPFAYAAAA